MNREEKSEMIKGKITKALFTILKEKTLDDMTADEIAQEASVSKRTLYKYFSSKKDMYLHLIKNSYAEIAEHMDSAVTKLVKPSPWEIIECIGRTYFSYSMNNPEKSRLMLSFNENDYRSEYEEKVNGIASVANTFEVASVLKKAYEDIDEAPPFDVRTTAVFLWSQIEGLVSLLINKGSWIESYYEKNPEQLINEHMDILRKVVNL